ncbi:MAG: tetratricopeptide repeat protein [Candidatus Cloacimonadaceae bacterium]
MNSTYESILYKIRDLVDLKRQGKFGEAISGYQQLDKMYPQTPVIIKSWAKTLSAAGYYNTAIEKYTEAAQRYRLIGDMYESEICNRHMQILIHHKRMGFNLRDPEFIEYIKQISGTRDLTGRDLTCKD